jgi:hypothetical protein
MMNKIVTSAKLILLDPNSFHKTEYILVPSDYHNRLLSDMSPDEIVDKALPQIYPPEDFVIARDDFGRLRVAHLRADVIFHFDYRIEYNRSVEVLMI